MNALDLLKLRLDNGLITNEEYLKAIKKIANESKDIVADDDYNAFEWSRNLTGGMLYYRKK